MRDRERKSTPAAKAVTTAADRALAEAAERHRRKRRHQTAARPEIGGRAGPDPVRYGDWERNGIASDF